MGRSLKDFKQQSNRRKFALLKDHYLTLENELERNKNGYGMTGEDEEIVLA